MPRRTDIHNICIIGSGPVVIGQAAEFDYSGTQAIKALKEEGFRVILINSNPASIMTNSNIADRTYIEPLTLEYVTKILEKERPCALLPTVGGQTALNLAVELHNAGVLKRLNIELIGADINAIEKAENRDLFKKVMADAGLPTLRSTVCHSEQEAKHFLAEFGLPIIIRPSFTLGGTGGGIAYTENQFSDLVKNGLELSPNHQVLIEESVIGFKEYEFEVIRDEADNAVIVCSIENFDPMGVHTGDSITVAPAQTLSDPEYQILRNASLKVLRAIGVKTGGSNVQFAVNPKNGRFAVIEMNPRVSRSSALASKATGYPIAKVAAKLAVGFHLDEIINDITQKTTAAFEPALDYVVTKIPKFAFEKFQAQEPHLTTQMRSVGEVMAIGRTFKESLHKAMASLEESFNGFDLSTIKNEVIDTNCFKKFVGTATPRRLWRVAAAFHNGYQVDEVAQASGIDPWFLQQIYEIVLQEQKLINASLSVLSAKDFYELKSTGFLDARIAQLLGENEHDVRRARLKLGVAPIYKRVDTCAGEFQAHTPYLYSTYEDDYFSLSNGKLVKKSACEANVTNLRKVVVIGSGPIRIGQGIEFDCCSTESILALKKLGIEAIMINSNPETLSTDFDIADRLYFEPITFEHIANVLNIEKPLGVIVQLGGQTPLSLARSLSDAGFPILGTSPNNIDRAEDRERSSQLFSDLGFNQPASVTAMDLEKALIGGNNLGYPLMVRPSYVLGGRAMERVYSEEELSTYIEKAFKAAPNRPVLIDRFLDGAIELDVDALSDGDSVYIAGILQHIEEAGIHSGDSAAVLPPYDLGPNLVDEISTITRRLCRELQIKGLINIQFAIKNNACFIIEANPRASRTVPFISKATNIPLAALATRIMCGESMPTHLKNQDFRNFMPSGITAIKAPVMPFSKFPAADPLLGPEMRSTGEVMSMAQCFSWAFIKGLLSAGTRLPSKGVLFVSVADRDKEALLPAFKQMYTAGFSFVATAGTHWFLKAHDIESRRINKVREGSPHVLDLLESNEIDLMFNTILGSTSVHDSHLFRKAALKKNIPYFTSVSAAKALAHALVTPSDDTIYKVVSMQDHHGSRYE
ncbi:MAG: carbamoyl-phosphate synthase large subunit [Myxococcales bacterium]|nr:carbamoyl-phosphate synthase large subunit [Myxococcales bacterium]USN51332.1 MAG: carbamoyl-phosphate synthase large subunit [Myxococcales bacterium]